MKESINKMVKCIETGNQNDITVGKSYHAIRIDEGKGIIAIEDDADDPEFAYWYPIDWFEDIPSLTDEQCKFLKNEADILQDDLIKMSAEEIRQVYDKFFWIKVEEDEKAKIDGEISERSKKADSLNDYIFDNFLKVKADIYKDEELQKFLKDEFNLEPDDLQNMSHDQINDLWEKTCWIEVEESEKIKGEEDISDRGRLAGDLNDYLADNF